MSWSLIDIGSTSDLAIPEVSFTKTTSIKLDELWCRSQGVGDFMICVKPWSIEKCLLFHNDQCYWDS